MIKEGIFLETTKREPVTKCQLLRRAKLETRMVRAAALAKHASQSASVAKPSAARRTLLSRNFTKASL